MAASNSFDVTVWTAEGEADCLKDLNVNTGPGKERIADFKLIPLGCSLIISQASWVMDCIN
jgi:hypothetical protein